MIHKSYQLEIESEGVPFESDKLVHWFSLENFQLVWFWKDSHNVYVWIEHLLSLDVTASMGKQVYAVSDF